MDKRYLVTKPVEGGFAYYRVADTQSDIQADFGVATFYKDMPNAQAEANALAERLNGTAWDRWQ